MDGFKIEKGVCQGGILSHCLFNFYAEYIMWNAGLDEAQAGIKMPGEITITSAIEADDSTMSSAGWKRRGIKESLDEGERGE